MFYQRKLQRQAKNVSQKIKVAFKYSSKKISLKHLLWTINSTYGLRWEIRHQIKRENRYSDKVASAKAHRTLKANSPEFFFLQRVTESRFCLYMIKVRLFQIIAFFFTQFCLELFFFSPAQKRRICFRLEYMLQCCCHSHRKVNSLIILSEFNAENSIEKIQFGFKNGTIWY